LLFFFSAGNEKRRGEEKTKTEWPKRERGKKKKGEKGVIYFGANVRPSLLRHKGRGGSKKGEEEKEKSCD